MIPAVLAILLGVSGGGPADPKGDLAKRLAIPLSPGAVALLVGDTETPAVVARIEAALRDPRSETRAAAARVVMTAPVPALQKAVEDALAAETDAEAAREEIRALVAVSQPSADLLFAASDRFDGRLDPDLARILARQRGPAAMPALLSARVWNLTPGEWADAVWIASRGNADALVPALARTLGSKDALRWGALLRLLVREDVVAGRNVVASGLHAAIPDMAGRAAWYMTWVRLKEPLPTDRELVEPLTPPEGASADTAYFFDLLRRTFAEPPGDQSEWMASLEDAKTSFADTIDPGSPWLELMSPAERDALRRRYERRNPTGAGAKEKASDRWESLQRGLTPKQGYDFEFRGVSGLPRGVPQDAMKVGKCRPSKGEIFGLAAVMYGPDGRPQAVRPYYTKTSEACEDVARALVMMTLAKDEEFPTGGEPVVMFGIARSDCLSALEEPDVCPSVCPEDRFAVRRVDATVEAPIIVERVEPVYRPSFRRGGKQGVVILEATIGEDGCVREIRLKKRVDPALDLEAARAVTQWKYRPAKYQGRPVAVYLTVTVTFRL